LNVVSDEFYAFVRKISPELGKGGNGMFRGKRSFSQRNENQVIISNYYMGFKDIADILNFLMLGHHLGTS